MLELSGISTITITFFIAGLVKGVVGLGLPTVSLALLTIAFDLPTAMALLIVPSFVTNLWQAVAGQGFRAIVTRLWPFLIAATLFVWLGANMAGLFSLAWMSALLGALLVIYALTGLARAPVVLSEKRERWLGPLLGAVNGILTGMTGSFVVPGVMYLQAVGLSRDNLVQAMGVLFTLSTVALAIALHRSNALTAELTATSAAAVVPAAAGLLVGQRLRRRLSEARFRQVFFVAIFVLGVYIVASVLGGIT